VEQREKKLEVDVAHFHVEQEKFRKEQELQASRVRDDDKELQEFVTSLLDDTRSSPGKWPARSPRSRSSVRRVLFAGPQSPGLGLLSRIAASSAAIEESEQ
jgi:hypothetical protein